MDFNNKLYSGTASSYTCTEDCFLYSPCYSFLVDGVQCGRSASPSFENQVLKLAKGTIVSNLAYESGEKITVWGTK